MIRSSLLFVCILTIATPYFGWAQNNPARTNEYKKIFTTYPFSDPDPIPKPDSKIYPYYRFDGFTTTPVQKEWTVVELENDYIRITILPEVGGKIWSATEKSTGKDFIYNNHVIKFRDVAMRGPWTSGGIEANYGIIGHTPNCATPVDYLIKTKEDGSVSCIIGVLDLLTRTHWSLDINLPKDKAYFTTTSFWHNSTQLEQPYYTWMNTGIKTSGNLQFIYPGNKYLGHEGEFGEWPINPKNGKDISWYENNDFGGYKSYHVFGKYTDFFGAYWHNDDFGMGHFSSHDDKAGKKIWIWGLSQQGMIWEKLLTDTDGQYVEVQSGRLFNQSADRSIFTPFKHRSFLPGQSDTWTEYWFPVKGSKGFVQANELGAVNVTQKGEWLRIYFSPLQTVSDKLELVNDEGLLYRNNMKAKPLETFSDSIRFSGDIKKVKLTLGENKMVWSPSSGDLQRPVSTPGDFDNNSVYGLFLQGKNLSSYKDYVGAEVKLNASLQKDPYFVPALVEMASLQLRRFQYDAALASAKKALSIDTYNAAANYYYALANLQLGNVDDAKDGFDLAAQGIEFRSAAYSALSKLYLREKEIAKAITYANKGLQSNANNVDAMQVLVVCHRLQNQTSDAEKLRQSILAVDPLNHFASFEKYLADKSDASNNQFTSSIRNEILYQTYLELGIWYYQVGCTKEAQQVLSLSPVAPEVVYWRSFLEGKLADLKLIKLGRDFPFRAETANVLYQLIEAQNHWQLKYHLGLIEWNRNNIDAAKKLFTQCGDEPADPNFYAAKASLFKDDSLEVERSLNKAIGLNLQEWRYPKLLAEHFISKNQIKKANDLIANYYQQHKQNYIIGMLYAKTLLLNHEFATCSTLLSSLQIIPFEGATMGRLLYQEAKLMLALNEMKSKRYKEALQLIASAREWPTHLGVGKPYAENIDERLEDWLDYNCYLKLGDAARAKNALQRIIDFNPQVDNTVANFIPGNSLVSAWALEKTSSKKEGEGWLQQQAALFPANKIIQWSLLTFNQEKTNLLPDQKDLSVRVLEELLQWSK